jgi:hypothetical protein
VADDGVVYMEVPNNLTYSNSKGEGFYEQGVQREWHLTRETWEKFITEAGFKIVRYASRPGAFWELIWILIPA